MLVMRPLILLAVVALTLAGCAGVPEQPAAPVEDPLAQAANRHAEQGDFLLAAQLYLTAAGTAPEKQRTALRLQGGEYLARGRLWEPLARLLAGMDPDRLDPPLPARFQLLAAELDLSQQRVEQALERLRSISHPEQLPDQGQRYYSVRAEAFALAGFPIEAARQLMALDGLVRDRQQRLENQYRIWEHLSSLSTAALAALETPPAPDPLSGWIELVRISRDTRGDEQRWSEALYAWRARYPGHAAEAALLPDLFDRLSQPRERPAHIGVLLPLSSAAAESANAIRDGILAAYYLGETPRPQLRFYDTGEEGRAVWQTYQQALQDGAGFLIGPLLKQDVEQLASAGGLSVPVLALNQVEARSTSAATAAGGPEAASNPPAAGNPAKPASDPGSSAAAPVSGGKPLYQFGLSPEDEARQAAERLYRQGYLRVIALVPANAWGERVLAAFREHLSELGGTLLDVGRYAPDTADFKGPIEATLNLDDSRKRHQALERLLGQDLQYEARRRQDVQALFVLGFPQQVRLIRPQLRFHHAGDVPVFSTSHAFDAGSDPTMDRDMDGVYFCDIPWVLDTHGSWAEKRKRLSALWPGRNERYQRLFALGFDAYQVIPWLDTLNLPGFGYFSGATGTLSLDQDNALHRTLEWAQFRNGVPHKLQATPPMSMEGQDESQGYGGSR